MKAGEILGLIGMCLGIAAAGLLLIEIFSLFTGFMSGLDPEQVLAQMLTIQWICLFVSIGGLVTSIISVAIESTKTGIIGIIISAAVLAVVVIIFASIVIDTGGGGFV